MNKFRNSKKLVKLLLALSYLAVFDSGVYAGSISPPTTPTGISLDAPWKVQVYEFAKKNVVHPSWGLAHSERDYQTTYLLARGQGIAIDLDVLFACAFLHDLGGLGQFKKEGVDHAVRSAELSDAILQPTGFPMEKLPQVKEMILGHTYYGPVPQSKAAFLFRDADILDFLGTIGIARILAITEESKNPALASTVGLINSFITDLPPKISSPMAQNLAKKRTLEMKSFIQSLGLYTYGGKAL